MHSELEQCNVMHGKVIQSKAKQSKDLWGEVETEQYFAMQSVAKRRRAKQSKAEQRFN